MNSASHSLSNGLGISYVGFEQSFLVHAREKEKILEASCSARSSSSSDSVAAIVHNDDALFVNSIVLKMLYILRWFFDLQFIISRSKWCKSKSMQDQAAEFFPAFVSLEDVPGRTEAQRSNDTTCLR